MFEKNTIPKVSREIRSYESLISQIIYCYYNFVRLSVNFDLCTYDIRVKKAECILDMEACSFLNENNSLETTMLVVSPLFRWMKISKRIKLVFFFFKNV